MSCGLGAIVLVFMLVKHNVQNSVLETDLLKNDLQRLEEKGKDLHEQITEIDSRQVTIFTRIEKVSSEIEKIRDAVSKTKSEMASQTSQKKTLQKAIETIKISKKPDVIEDIPVGEENYIIGLRVTGRKIGILVDSSSSMTDEILIDVIRRKNSSVGNKKVGPKWQRTKKIIEWLLARIPQQSDFNVITFNNNTSQLGGQGWKGAGDASAMGRVLGDLDLTVPEGSTNLHAGLEAIAALNPTDIYLITDGLPTDGSASYKSLNPFASCSSLLGGASTISGECRAKLFRHTVNSLKLPGVTVNVILLPIEGDPEASKEFWNWTSLTNGLLISPAASWP
jgi:CRISPR/Cas system-associated endoribonuclease Cas2